MKNEIITNTSRSNNELSKTINSNFSQFELPNSKLKNIIGGEECKSTGPGCRDGGPGKGICSIYFGSDCESGSGDTFKRVFYEVKEDWCPQDDPCATS